MQESQLPPDQYNIIATPVLRVGESVVLRPAELDDAESFLQLVSANFERLTRWLGISEAPSTTEGRRKMMAADLAPVERNERHWWMIELDGQLVGTIDIHAIQKKHRWGLVGYWLAEGCTGRGLMTDSLRTVIDWAFSDLGLVRIEVLSAIGNRASCAVPERLGIRREAICKQFDIINGVPHDMASYAAFADNWPPKPPDRALPNNEIRVDDEILLRQFRESDRDATWQAFDSGREYLSRYLPWMEGYPTEEAHTRGFNQRLAERDHFDGSGGYAIEYRGELAGAVGFGAPNRDNGIEAGYWLRQDLQGRGIMTRSVEKVIDMLIHEIGIHRVVIRAATSNAPSRGIPERLGFTHEGTMRGAGFVKNEYLDLEIYSMLDHEWVARSNRA